jgi:uncharacterized protein (DUF2336 family)
MTGVTVDINFVHQVEDAIEKGAIGRRGELLQRVTDLFIVGADQYTEEEISLFDDVITRLAADIELSARALLAARLAPVPNAPPQVIRALAFDDVIDVAGPILAQSERLDDPTLVENARQKSQEHLLAISLRRTLSEPVTDVLVERGDQQVVLSTVENRGARFSERGFATLVQRSTGDDNLAMRVGSRPEIPPHLFLNLLAVASESVRAKLEAEHPHARREVREAVAEATGRIRVEALTGSLDYSAARMLIDRLNQSGHLDDARLREFASAGRIEETTVALAVMSDLPLPFIERALIQERSETLLIVAKVIGLSWPTVKAILLLRTEHRIVPTDGLAQCLSQFERLKPAIANEIVRFYRMRERAAARKFN